MKTSDDNPWKLLCEGPTAEVWIHRDCEKELKGIRQPKMEAKIRAHMMVRFCQFELLDGLNREQFNPNEGKHSIDGAEVMMSAFKSNQLRVYGAVGSVNNNRAFFAASAILKKQDQLKPKDIKKAAGRLVELSKAISGAKV